MYVNNIFIFFKIIFITAYQNDLKYIDYRQRGCFYECGCYWFWLLGEACDAMLSRRCWIN
jgi:hypothetical protein